MHHNNINSNNYISLKELKNILRRDLAALVNSFDAIKSIHQVLMNALENDTLQIRKLECELNLIGIESRGQQENEQKKLRQIRHYSRGRQHAG